MEETVDHVLTSAGVAFVLTALLLLAFAEIGFRIGLRVHAAHDEARKSTIGGIQGAVLGLLGLFLGFTFAMAVTRYETRRALVVEEANAIGTTYLRASLLPEAHAEPVRGLLRRYVDLRLEYQPRFNDAVVRAEGLARSAEMQRRLWEHAVASAKEAPGPMVASFIASLNEAIDTEAERVAASRNRIPISVWVLLLIVAACGCLTSAYAAGCEGVRSAFSSLVLPLLIAVVVMLLFDLMHPHQGLIGVSQQPFLDLQQGLVAPGGG